ncbi:MAG: hypothetical protein M3292_06010 [Actinomycetota bacterium]|nr:hypothetical protein [Actinomycetota bacterium]
MFFSHFDAETTLRLVREAGLEVVDAHREVQVEGGKDVAFLWVLAHRSGHGAEAAVDEGL